MKRLLLSAACLAALSSAAWAADWTQDPGTAYTWTGVYVGIHGGYSWGEGDFTLRDSGLDSIVIENDGWLAGGHIGANYQMGLFVVGAELGGGWIDSQGEDSDVHGLGWRAWTKEDFQATAKARAGVAFDRALVYVVGGYAGSQFQLSAHENCPGECVGHGGSDQHWVNGALVGAGFEYALADPIVVGVEFNHIFQNDQEFTDKVLGHDVSADGDLSRNQVVVRGSLKF